MIDHFFHALLGPRPSFWRTNFLAWTGFAIFLIVARFLVFPNFWEALVFSAIQVPLGMGLSGLLREFYRRPGVADPFRVSTAAWIIGLGLLAGIADAWLYQKGIEMTGWYRTDITADIAFDLRIKLFWMVYMSWSVGYFAVRAKLEAAAEAELARAAGEEARRMELQLLRAQLDPHFLFNALNSIAAEIRPHPDSAQEMVVLLADYLRYSLDHRNRTIGSLGDELNAVDAYLAIQRARFGDRLQAKVSAQPRARNRRVPNFLLQPLVENAVKHGMETAAPHWELAIQAMLAGDTLTVEVRNVGALAPPDPDRVGVGIETLRRRLAIHYPKRHRFELVQEGGFVCARLILRGEPCSA